MKEKIKIINDGNLDENQVASIESKRNILWKCKSDSNEKEK